MSFHRIDYDRLEQVGWKAILSGGLEWIHEMARALLRENGFDGLGCDDHETLLVVQHSEEVLSKERWQKLHQASNPDTMGKNSCVQQHRPSGQLCLKNIHHLWSEP
ncbi:hypothetical protein IV203_024392 [Nitzschia inconspicua]|uniref:Uncharacterized protein n=1 Tax=Nitzschia inconspicua TaxID=303405 RepID=A0A9K3KBR8_9STRA|nr:hypothetical protein IV203_024392 [Nitzschia inconspicua]